MENHTRASGSAHDVKDNMRRRKRRQRPDDMAYLHGSTAPTFKICDEDGHHPLKPSLIPLARALILLDVQLFKRVQNFYQNRAASLDEARKARGVPSLEECFQIRQQWKNIDSGQRQFSQLYMKSDHFVPVWKEGLRIVKEALQRNQTFNNQSQKRNDFEKILSQYETLAESLKSQIVDAAHRGLLEAEVFYSIQARWIRLDEILDWYYDLYNINVDEDVPHVSRRSSNWLEVRRIVQPDDLRKRSDKELVQVQPASRSRKETEPGTTGGPRGVKIVSAFILWIAFFSCAVISIALFALGYGRSPHLQGTASDPDFWFLIQATFMQILGLVVSALLERNRGGLPTWRWGLPTAIAGACSIMAIPLYLTAPKEWSSFLSLVAGATQSFMTLQLFCSMASITDQL